MIRFTLLILLSVHHLAAQTPEWVSTYGSNSPYPSEKFIAGFGMAAIENTREEALERAKAQASSDLTRKIQVTVKSAVVSIEEATQRQYSESLSSVVEMTSNMRIDGIRFDVAEKGNSFYVLSSLSRESFYTARVEEAKLLLSKLTALTDDGKKSKSAKRPAEALDAFLSAEKIAAEMLEKITLAQSVGGKRVPQNEIGGSGATGALEYTAAVMQSIRAEIQSLYSEPLTSLDEAASLAANRLAIQGVKRGDISVAELTYQSADFSSPFGVYFAEKLSGLLKSKVTFAPEKIIVKGSYWVKSDAIECILVAVSPNGEPYGSLSITFAKKLVPKELSLLPQNAEQALRDQRVLGTGRVTDGGIGVEVWTSKGRNAERVVFQQGEKVELFFRVNQPAYLQLSYILATGERVMMEEKFYIGIDKVNQVVKYPVELECAPPFGVERLIVTAFSTEPPKQNLSTKKIAGEEYEVFTENLQQSMAKTRGFKKSSPKGETPKLGEATLTITTMARVKI